MQVAQSYLSTLFRHRFTVYEMRVFLCIVRRTRQVTKARGVHYKDYMDRPFCTDGLNLNFTVPISTLSPGSHNYKGVQAALKTLSDSLYVEYWDKSKRIWRRSSLIYNVVIDSRHGFVGFSAAKWLVDYICDFTAGGYREYDWEIAMSLRNPFSARLYLLLCSATSPMVYSIEAIKKTLGIDGVYSRPSDLIKRVIEPARKELESRDVNGFSFEQIKKIPGVQRSGTVALKFYPVKRGKLNKNISEIKKDVDAEIPESIQSYLRQAFGFSIQEIAHNKNVIGKFSKLEDWNEKFFDITERTRRLRKNKFYIIAAMKKEIQAREGEY